MPENYPDAPGDLPAQEWFSATVNWWQQPRAGRSAAFNHGQRLLAYGSIDPKVQLNGFDQIQAAAEALDSKAESSRAIAVLVDPISDLKAKRPLFPAFVLVQFQIVGTRLDVTAYFRKQEMPHWWPVNVGELAKLQFDVIDALTERGKPLSPGAITTVTAMPVTGGSVPRVAVPDLDRRADDSTGMLDLVLPLYDLAAPSTDVVARWREAFTDWIPGEKPPADGDPIPLFGLRELLAVLDAVIAISPTSTAIRNLRTEIHVLRAECEIYDKTEESDRRKVRETWRKAVAAHTRKIDTLVFEIVGSKPKDAVASR